MTSAPISLRLHGADNVALALQGLAAGAAAEGIILRQNIPEGHKFALESIPRGEPVIKYSSQIGIATAPIKPGEHVHVHNVAMPPTRIRRSMPKSAAEAPSPEAERTFQGIVRPDGCVATRNYVGILTTVNCSATAARAIAARMRQRLKTNWRGVDDVVALTHQHGCAMAPNSEGLTILRRTLVGYARHPNFAGVLLLGLGCESNELGTLIDACGGLSDRIRALEIQHSGGTRAVIKDGARLVGELLDMARDPTRTACPVSKLVVGLQCGGSDSFSALTANPALGAAVDLLAGHGGTGILSETPEIFGAEHLLAARAWESKIAGKLEERVQWWRSHVAAHGRSLNDNPSAGNIAGGITTIIEKSLGAVAKGGTTALRGVYEYGEPVEGPGLVFMDSPGFDPMSATGQVASGANLIAFTTGRGSTFGCKPVPSIKLSTNSKLFGRMREDMDVNCGDIADGSASIEQKGREIFEALIRTASGEYTASEQLGFGEAEFAPWVPGAVT
jgi:altronate hydrolase